jgi:hypothetical protein
MRDHHKFWTLIKKLDMNLEKKCDAAYVNSKLTKAEKKYVKTEMLYFISVLNHEVDYLVSLKKKSNKFKADLYSYIIGRGIKYFIMIINTPRIVDDLIDDHIPLWSYL